MKYLLDTDHISFLQRRSGSEFRRLTVRMASHLSSDFAVSIVSFHEQVIGAHDFINRTRTNRDMIRGYTFWFNKVLIKKYVKFLCFLVISLIMAGDDR